MLAALLSRYCDAATSTNKPTQLFSFSGGADGGTPKAALIEGSDGRFYGTTSRGGASDTGTVFAITSAGSLTTLYSFSGAVDGATPLDWQEQVRERVGGPAPAALTDLDLPVSATALAAALTGAPWEGSAGHPLDESVMATRRAVFPLHGLEP